MTKVITDITAHGKSKWHGFKSRYKYATNSNGNARHGTYEKGFKLDWFKPDNAVQIIDSHRVE